MDMAHIMWKRMACRFKKQDNRVDISELIMNDLTEDIDIRKTLRKGIGDAKAAKNAAASPWCERIA